MCSLSATSTPRQVCLTINTGCDAPRASLGPGSWQRCDIAFHVQEKIEAIAKETYGAGSVEYLPQAEKQIELYTKMGFAGLPICMAKTQYSFSADAAAKVPVHPEEPASCHHSPTSASHCELSKNRLMPIRETGAHHPVA